MVKQSFHTPAGVRVPAVSATEMRAVDRVAIDDVGIDLLQLMENAGRTLASHVLAVGTGPTLVVAGNGGNGGGGLACARHLANHDVAVEIVLDRDPNDLTGAVSTQYRILHEMGLPVRVGPDAIATGSGPTAIVDALIGYGLAGDVREPVTGLVRAMNGQRAPVVSLDIPSGVDATTGEVLGYAVEPERTVTLALPKTGLVDRDESLVLADIAIPRTVYDRLDIEYENPFGRDAWTELRQ